MRWFATLSVAVLALVGGSIGAACGGGASEGSGFTGGKDASAPDIDGAPTTTSTGTTPVDAAPPPLLTPDGGLLPTGDGGCFQPLTCTAQGIACGSAGDGCGNVIQCGNCTAPDICGGGGTPSQCGDNTPCTPATCATLHASCGQQGDGCGHIIQCGNCSLPDTCGGGGTANQCGAAASGPDSGPPAQCTPKTCAQASAACGQVADGCGGLTVSCGTCSPPSICGGGGVANQCGDSNLDGGVVSCTNLCPMIPQCNGGGTTTIKGVVYSPATANPDPLYNALVYIPNSVNGALDAFPQGVKCDSCSAEVSGDPLVSTTSAADGSFTLTGVPAGASIPIVFQLGRWRREVFVTVNPCVVNTLTPDQSRMPRKQEETTAYDNIPLTAMVTGDVDALECVLMKLGIDQTQFGDPTTPAYGASSPRIQFYKGDPSANSDGLAGATYSSSTPKEDTLWASAATLEQYDQVLLACQGGADTKKSAALANMLSYANAGGRVYATHYSYDWIFTNSPWSTTADWSDPDTGDDPASPDTAYVDETFADGQAFAAWLLASKATMTPGQVQISVSRHDFSTPLKNGGQQWLYTTDPDQDTPLHYTFNTPVNAATQCGRVLFSDFHVNDSDTYGKKFPAECSGTTLSAQEKILEFMIFNLASCVLPVAPPPPPMCTPETCAQVGAMCGPAGDGCGNVIQCGNCAAGQACGAGGSSVCGPVANPCTPTTCGALGVSCGPAGDGCGNLIMCGNCPPPETCGGGGTPGKCGSPTCTPLTCAGQNATCGVIADGCGNTLDCGECVLPQTCGGGGTPNQCGGGTR